MKIIKIYIILACLLIAGYACYNNTISRLNRIDKANLKLLAKMEEDRRLREDQELALKTEKALAEIQAAMLSITTNASFELSVDSLHASQFVTREELTNILEGWRIVKALSDAGPTNIIWHYNRKPDL